ncbi:hypothetical protein LUZ60_009182 [Juncus effusus]|nr:hypothetical protein LUZ60_009182 [Juncus effusus]
MDPLLRRCQEKLSHFRLRDLQEVLRHLGMGRQGKKQDLMDRILVLLQSDQDSRKIEKLIDSISSNISGKKQKTETIPEQNLTRFDSLECKKDGVKVWCLCGSSLFLEPMIQCEEKICNVWQHAGCVIVPDPVLQTFQIPSPFFCEICRVNHSDPFWVTIAHPLSPTKLVPYQILTDPIGTKESIEKWFQLSNHHMQLLERDEYELQVWIMLLNDEVQFRVHWPLASVFHVNGVPVQVLSRPDSQLLGINSRDDGPLIKKLCKEGMNKITLSWCDTRTYCLGIRLAKRRTIHQVVSMVPKEGESFQEGLARVCRCIGGGNEIKNEENNNNDNSDDDLELISDRAIINLRCPIGGKRIKIAARFKPCSHMACFDLFTFIQINSHACKWQCPICLKNYRLDNLIIDSYFSRVTAILDNYDEELTEIEVKKDGTWRIKSDEPNSPWQKFHHSISPTVNPVHHTPEPNNYENAPLLMPNISPFVDHPTQFPQFLGGFSGNYSNPNLNLPLPFGDWNSNFPNPNFPNPNFSNPNLPCQNEWIPLSLAAGIVQPVPVEASSSIQNLNSLPNLGRGIADPSLANNQQSFQNPKILMNYDNHNFSQSMNYELNHNSIDPNFQFFY